MLAKKVLFNVSIEHTYYGISRSTPDCGAVEHRSLNNFIGFSLSAQATIGCSNKDNFCMSLSRAVFFEPHFVSCIFLPGAFKRVKNKKNTTVVYECE